MAHAKLGPSAAKRWMSCPGSIRMSEGMPNKSSRFADEGTAAHALGEALIRHELEMTEEAEEAAFSLANAAPEEMREAVDVYVEKVLSYVRVGFGERPATILLEQAVTLDPLEPAAPVWGTADCIVYVPALRRLVVIDYKHGAGVVVEVERNHQLMIYALAAWMSVGQKFGWDVQAIETCIVQPRAYHERGPVRSHTYSPMELLDFADDVLIAVRETLRPDAALQPGEHCVFCPAKGVCPERGRQAAAAMPVPFLPKLPSASAMTIEQCCEVLAAAENAGFESWLKGIAAHVQAEAEAGRETPGYKLVAKRASRKWAKAEAEIVEAIRMLDPAAECFDAPKLKSVAEMEKAVGKKRFPAALYTKESSGHNLVQISAPGAALTLNPADDFADLPMIEL